MGSSFSEPTCTTRDLYTNILSQWQERNRFLKFGECSLAEKYGNRNCRIVEGWCALCHPTPTTRTHLASCPPPPYPPPSAGGGPATPNPFPPHPPPHLPRAFTLLSLQASPSPHAYPPPTSRALPPPPPSSPFPPSPLPPHHLNQPCSPLTSHTTHTTPPKALCLLQPSLCTPPRITTNKPLRSEFYSFTPLEIAH